MNTAKVDPMAQRTHPHGEATYRVIPSGDAAFAVEVSIPEQLPAKVNPFATEADAEAWITEHRRRVQFQSEPTSRGTSAANRGGRPE
jgi:hypothetical protein